MILFIKQVSLRELLKHTLIFRASMRNASQRYVNPTVSVLLLEEKLTPVFAIASFLTVADVSGQRADVRKQIKEQSTEKEKLASPVPSISDSKCTEWEPKLSN